MKGKIILNLAMSLDGYIVDNNGNYDWIRGDGDESLNTVEQYELFGLIERYDYIVMGYTSFIEFGQDEHWKNKKLIVATHEKLNNTENTTFVSEELIPLTKRLRDQGHMIWLFGGSLLTDNYIKVNEVDQYEVAIIPIILGNGKRLFLDDNPKIKLHLKNYTINEGIPLLIYTKRGSHE
ncbi:hypothetical protein CI105_08555 [Candidatus Izimaplasma bacterium ZiA1]|uniref:dihydrofolate reductase family protein n=1 Tax=Candidatus Izimoplasma sp. ZiA1 TaxID=2024899 RepID=UPI000BAA82B3|nr:hypothetical protein CI105_08555 [Candidatus Izimaplasma bacterium ZiA1]